MTSHTNGEVLPLLGLTVPRRVHYLDNLRASLTILLIFHHAAVECTPSSLPMHLFININKSALWGLFFFVSGYSSTLALGSTSEFQFFISRTVKIGLPAWIYAAIGHRILFYTLTIGWSDVFGKPDPGWAYNLLSGPSAYVFYLLIMDYMHLALRLWKREFPSTVPSLLALILQPTSYRHFHISVEFSALFLTLYIFIRCLAFHITPPILSLLAANDYPSFDAPVAYVVAYVVGMNFADIQSNFLDISLSRGYTALFISIIFSSSSMAVAQYLSTSMQQFIRLRNQYFFVNPGLNLHTVFYAVWCTFVFLTIPYSVVSIFVKMPMTNREWGFLARHTYIQMYVNMIPILVAVRYTTWVGDVFLRVFIVGVFGVIVSWITMLGVLLLGLKIRSWLQRET